MEDLNNWTKNIYMKLYKKYLYSKICFITLSVISFSLIALMIILNIFAIKKNQFRNTVPLYVAISILTGFVGLSTSIVSFFTLNKNSNKYKTQYKHIEEEYKLYKAKEGKYEGSTRDEVIINSIMLIISDNK